MSRSGLINFAFCLCICVLTQTLMKLFTVLAKCNMYDHVSNTVGIGTAFGDCQLVVDPKHPGFELFESMTVTLR